MSTCPLGEHGALEKAGCQKGQPLTQSAAWSRYTCALTVRGSNCKKSATNLHSLMRASTNNQPASIKEYVMRRPTCLVTIAAAFLGFSTGLAQAQCSAWEGMNGGV